MTPEAVPLDDANRVPVGPGLLVNRETGDAYEIRIRWMNSDQGLELRWNLPLVHWTSEDETDVCIPDYLSNDDSRNDTQRVSITCPPDSNRNETLRAAAGVLVEEAAYLHERNRQSAGYVFAATMLQQLSAKASEQAETSWLKDFANSIEAPVTLR